MWKEKRREEAEDKVLYFHAQYPRGEQHKYSSLRARKNLVVLSLLS